MRILESAPRRYDRGIRLLSLGRVEAMYRAVAQAAVLAPGARVLEIGCGTGNLTRALLDRGAVVTAIDQDPDMLAIATGKLGDVPGVTFSEMAAAEVADRFPEAGFDAVAASLVLSEMDESEQDYVLRASLCVLRPGGRLVVADEVLPPGRLARAARAVVRVPLAVITYALTQTTTSAVRDLPRRTAAAGFRIVEERWLGRGGVGLVVAEHPEDGA